MDDNKDLPAFAEIRTVANHVRNSMLSTYIRTIARVITVLAKRPAPRKPANAIPVQTEPGDCRAPVPSRRAIVTALAIGALAMDSPRIVQAAPASLLGTWKLVTFTSRHADGRVEEAWGPHPAGQIAYDADGNLMALLMHERRNEADGTTSPPELQGEFSAYFGTYRVDAAQGVIVHQVTASLAAGRASKELRRNFEIKDGLLFLSFVRTRNGVSVTQELIWRRISPKTD